MSFLYTTTPSVITTDGVLMKRDMCLSNNRNILDTLYSYITLGPLHSSQHDLQLSTSQEPKQLRIHVISPLHFDEQLLDPVNKGLQVALVAIEEYPLIQSTFFQLLQEVPI